MVIPGKYQDGPWYAVKYIYIYDYDLWFTEEMFWKSEESYENIWFLFFRKSEESLKMNKKTWEKVRKVMKINEENSEKTLGKFEEKWGKLWS